MKNLFVLLLITFAHGLGRVPDLVQLRAICTATGDEDYVVGDIVVLPNSVVETEGDKEGVSVMLTTTEIKLFFAEDGIAIVGRERWHWRPDCFK